MITLNKEYKILSDRLRGKKPKFKVQKDGKTYIYKYGAINYEIWAELIAEQLGIQAGINMAHYRLASYNNTFGVLTDYFLEPGELIISCDNLKKASQEILNENNIPINLKTNSIENIMQAIYTYDNTIDCQQLSFDLTKRWAFYGLIMESDKNETNIGFIKSSTTGLRLTPDYDNSSMASLNNNINSNIDAIKSGYSIYYFTDNIKSNLNRSEKDTGFFLEDFKSFAEKHPKQCEEIIASFELINPEEAMNKVEEINTVTIPWEVRFWVNETIKNRKKDMKEILLNSQKKTKKNNI